MPPRQRVEIYDFNQTIGQGGRELVAVTTATSSSYTMIFKRQGNGTLLEIVQNAGTALDNTDDTPTNDTGANADD